MNLSKQYFLLLSFSKLNKKVVSKPCPCRKYCVLSSNRFQVAGVVSLHPKQLKYNYLCTKNDNKCWSCGSAVSYLFCDNCKSLQRFNKDSNYFELLGLNCTYDLKLPELTKKYRDLQSKLHPDKFGNKSEEERNISEEYSSIINKAFSTLSHPVERGLYMLELKGSSIEEATVQLDPKFLMEIMERNEEIEDERDPKKLSEYNRINKESIDALIRELLSAFEKDDITTAKEVLTKLKYYTSIDSKLKEIKQNLGIPD